MARWYEPLGESEIRRAYARRRRWEARRLPWYRLTVTWLLVGWGVVTLVVYVVRWLAAS